jgi:hypothetical protein
MPSTPRRSIITDVSQIPDFETEEEEVAFWDTHTMGPEMVASPQDAAAVRAMLAPMRAARERPSEARTIPVSVRFDGDTLGRLKALAARKGTGYQTLLKEFVVERLYEEEVREGIIRR